MRHLRYVLADVFTDTPLAGNPLAVFTDARDLDSLTMQALARELNLSETVFVLPPQAPDADIRLRIFTPATELPFAGHPVLGTAFVLGGPLQKIVLRFETGAGVVPVELQREGAAIRFAWMEQPLPSWRPFARGDELLAVLGSSGPGYPSRSTTSGPDTSTSSSTRRRRWRGSRRISSRSTRQPALRQLLRAHRRRLEDPRLLPRVRRARGPRDGLCGRAARGAPPPPRADRAGRGDRDRTGGRDRPPSTLYASAAGTPDQIDRVLVGGSAVLVARGEFRIP